MNTEYEVIKGRAIHSANNLAGVNVEARDFNPRDQVSVGAIVTFYKVPYRVEKAIAPANCKGCDLRTETGACDKGTAHPSCSGYSRSDGSWLIFKCLNKEQTDHQVKLASKPSIVQVNKDYLKTRKRNAK